LAPLPLVSLPPLSPMRPGPLHARPGCSARATEEAGAGASQAATPVAD